MIRLRNVCQGYYEQNEYYPILKDLSIDIENGEWVSVVGQSGVGKTTLLHCIAGLLRPNQGSAEYGKLNIYELTEHEMAKYRKEEIGIVFQDFRLIPYYTVVDNVMLPLVYDVDSKSLRNRAIFLLNSLGLGDKEKAFPEQLSGGEKQRVAIARAMISNPKVLICDEPTGNLDIINRNRILDVLQNLKKAGQTIIVVTHDHEIANYSNSVYVLADGRLQKKEVSQI